MFGVTAVAAYRQKTVLQSTAFELLPEVPLDLPRQRRPLCRHRGHERGLVLFGDPVKETALQAMARGLASLPVGNANMSASLRVRRERQTGSQTRVQPAHSLHGWNLSGMPWEVTSAIHTSPRRRVFMIGVRKRETSLAVYLHDRVRMQASMLQRSTGHHALRCRKDHGTAA